MSRGLESASEILFVIGILLTVAGIFYRLYRQRKDPYKGRATATVVGLIPDTPDSQGRAAGIHDYYYPVFAYYANGRLMKKRYNKGSNPPAFHIGDKVPLRFDTNAPEHFALCLPGKEDHLERFLYLGGLLCIIGGLVCYLLFGLRVLG